MRSIPRAVATVLMAMLLLPALGGVAFADITTPDPGVEIEEGGENCNGIIPTPGSENTVKQLVGGTLEPGGTAEYRIAYPVDPDEVGEEWEIVDCVLIGTGDDLKDYEVLDQVTFNGVVNNEAFELNITVDIPADALVGTTICNVAKTTEGPSAPQASNRKAGPACFVIGGAARVEKRSTEDPDGDPIDGATFEISDCENSAPDPDVQPIFVSNGDETIQVDEGETEEIVATNGYLSINGPAGSECTVTETSPPPGYALPTDPDDRSMTVTIPVGTGDSDVFVFLDPPLAPAIRVTKTCTGTVLVGEEITYEITVENTGTEDLTDVVVTDELLGGVLSEFGTTLDVGEEETEEFTYTATEGDLGSLLNTVTAEATGAETDEDVDDDADCTTRVLAELEPGIQIVKDGPDLVHVGDTVTYTFAVTNTGNVPLESVGITDPLCDEGTLSDFEGDSNDNGFLDLEEEWTASCTHVVTADDPDPLPNTAVVDATDTEDTPVSDSDDHVVDVIHPDIRVDKTASSTGGSPGDEITYTYVVTNTGDTTLFDISVDDDKLGHIGDIESLDPGESATLEATTTLPDDITELTNVVTAVGSDELGEEVSDEDEVTVSIVLGVIETRDEPPLARTGSTVIPVGQMGAVFILLGMVLLVLSIRRSQVAAPATAGGTGSVPRRFVRTVTFRPEAQRPTRSRRRYKEHPPGRYGP